VASVTPAGGITPLPGLCAGISPPEKTPEKVFHIGAASIEENQLYRNIKAEPYGRK